MDINGFSEATIIKLLRYSLDIAGDGGITPWNDGEYEACVEYLNDLENKLKARYTMECFNCENYFNIQMKMLKKDM
jgi:hypothetical protein